VIWCFWISSRFYISSLSFCVCGCQVVLVDSRQNQKELFALFKCHFPNWRIDSICLTILDCFPKISFTPFKTNYGDKSINYSTSTSHLCWIRLHTLLDKLIFLLFIIPNVFPLPSPLLKSIHAIAYPYKHNLLRYPTNRKIRNRK